MRNYYRNYRMGVLAGVAAIAIAHGVHAEEPLKHFEIKAVDLAAALEEFGQQSDSEILFDRGEAGRIKAPTLVGDYAPQVALKKILAGSGLAQRQVNSNTFVVEARSSSPAQREDNSPAVPTKAASAQTAEAAKNEGAAPEEVIVTARKRQETLLSVPVMETAISHTKLDSTQTLSIADLTKIVPGIIVSQSVGSGGFGISLHGLGQLASATTSDSAIALNLDGIQIGTGLAFQAGLFDLGQIEVLKGPQPLFFGKGTPGGVISLHTADPTDKFEVIGSAAYEFEARTPREELIISGPVTDTLKLRLASMYSTSEGYFKFVGVPVPGTGALAPASNRGPGETQYIVRGTALWNPTDQFDARLKVDVVHDRQTNNTTGELSSCPDGTGAPTGIPFIGAGNDCKIGRDIRTVDMNPANFPGINNNGIPFQTVDQKYGSLELNYHPTQNLTLTSLTGYYFLKSELLLNGNNTTGAGTPFAVATDAFAPNNRRDWTEEVRLNSDFNSPVNFTFGGLYLSDAQMTGNSVIGNSAFGLPAILDAVSNDFNSTAYSVFGQARYKITPELELAGGARWTSEDKNVVVTNLQTNTVVPVTVNHLHFKNVAPEVTLTYRPSDDMTLFASFKEAYLAGGFNVGPLPAANTDISFHDEKAEGGEVGLKSRWLDHQLTVDLSAYYYHYTGLQVGATVLLPSGQIQNTTVNAAAAKSYGVDLEADYAPEAVKGLTMNGGVNWNRARFIKLIGAPCYGGQTIANGCDQVFSPTANFGLGGFTGQDLSGTPILSAPEWQMSFGFDYAMPVGGDYKLVLGNNITYVSSFLGALYKNYPNNGVYQSAYAKVDLGLTLKAPDDRWEIALLGKNITDKIIGGNYGASDASSSFFMPSITGRATNPSPAGIDEINAFVLPGREIWLRVTLRPFN